MVLLTYIPDAIIHSYYVLSRWNSAKINMILKVNKPPEISLLPIMAKLYNTKNFSFLDS